MAKKYFLVDGERRWRAAHLAGMQEVDAIVLTSKPSQTEVRVVQMSIDAHRVELLPMERSDLLAKIKLENDWSVGQTAAQLNLAQPLVSKSLKLQQATTEVRAAVDSGKIDQDKAYTICQEPDPEKQRQLLREAAGLTREQLRQKARPGSKPVELKASIARFPLPTGVTITVAGRKMTLAGVIEAMLEAVKELKKGQADHWDVTTAMRVMRDRANVAK